MISNDFLASTLRIYISLCTFAYSTSSSPSPSPPSSPSSPAPPSPSSTECGGPYLNVVKVTGGPGSLQPQVVDGQGDSASAGDDHQPATDAAVGVEVGVVGGGDGA